MLCSRSASLMRTTPMSSIMARNILRRFSACCAFSREPAPSPSSAVQGMRLSLLTPSTSFATVTEFSLDLLQRDWRVFDHVME